MTTTDDAGWIGRVRNGATAALLGQSGFRRLYAATTISEAGDAVYFVAMTWLVFELTGSTAFTGLAVALTRLPALASVFVGPLVDRAPLGRLLPAVETTQAVVVCLVPAAHLLGVLSVWVVLAVVTVVASLQRLSGPAGQAALPRIVEDRLLARANSLVSASKQAVGAGAQAATGVAITVVGGVSLFLVDAVTFAVSAATLAALRVPSAGGTTDESETDEGTATDEETGAGDQNGAGGGESDAGDRTTGGGATTAGDETDAGDRATGPGDETDAGDRASGPGDEADGNGSSGLPTLAEYVADVREGIAVIRGSVLAYALGAAMVAGLGTGLSTAVLPAFGDTLAGATGYGTLVAAATGGTLLGSTVAARFEDRSFGLVVAGGFLLAAVARVAAAVLATPALVYLAFGLSAVPVGVYNVLVSTVVQVGVPNELLARVSSTNGTLLAVAGPVGLLAGGLLGDLVPPALVVGLSAVGFLLIAACWLAVPRLRSFGPVVTVEDGAFAP